MNLYVTEIRAFDPKTNEMKYWGGPNVKGVSESDAQNYIDNNGLGYCKIIGVLVAEIPCKEGTFEADMDKIVNYDFNNN